MATKNQIKELVRHRLMQVSKPDLRVLNYAALLGDALDCSILTLASGWETEQVAASLQRACGWGLVAQDREGSPGFRFRHALIREAIIEALPPSAASRCHVDIVRALERLPDVDSRVEALAYHAVQAQLADKALTYGERAGDGALASRALAEATHYYEVALAAADGPTSRERLRAKLANVARLESS